MPGRDVDNRDELGAERRLTASNIAIGADPSAAAFALGAAAIVPGSSVTIEGMMVNSTRTGLFEALEEMAARVELADERIVSGEVVADVTVWHCRLQGITIAADRIAAMIDEIPVLAVAAAIAMMIDNVDARSGDYLVEAPHRPEHADFAYQAKHGLRDPRGGGRASARGNGDAGGWRCRGAADHPGGRDCRPSDRDRRRDGCSRVAGFARRGTDRAGQPGRGGGVHRDRRRRNGERRFMPNWMLRWRGPAWGSMRSRALKSARDLKRPG